MLLKIVGGPGLGRYPDNPAGREGRAGGAGLGGSVGNGIAGGRSGAGRPTRGRRMPYAGATTASGSLRVRLPWRFSSALRFFSASRRIFS